MKKLIVTGSSGLIGSEVCYFFHNQGFEIHGIDNNQRAVFFGPQGDTRWNQNRLSKELSNFQHHEIDIRNREGIHSLVKTVKPDIIIHTAAQPSHDHANRLVDPGTPFIHMSTNKVYGDGPNRISLKELETRWEYDDPEYLNGIAETFSIDQCKHSLFGASKVAADVMVQEYGRYFEMPTCCLRGGCLTGPNHSGVEMHGFLSFLVKCNLEEREYNIYGYKGKQVRDNIHALDVVRFMYEFFKAPRIGEVYNIGGGKNNSCSILEAFTIAEKYSGKKQKFAYKDENRIGDHICYYSDLTKLIKHYPEWNISISLEETISQIVNAQNSRQQL
jgi:CDP-paratose 2-epimerase